MQLNNVLVPQKVCFCFHAKAHLREKLPMHSTKKNPYSEVA